MFVDLGCVHGSEIMDKKLLALEEYKLVERRSTAMYEGSMKIKNWSVTIGIAGIAAGFSQSPNVYLLSSLAILIFWMMDAHWRIYSAVYDRRMDQIEDFLSERVSEYDGPRIERTIDEMLLEERRFGYLPKAMWKNSVRNPHAYIFPIGIILFCFHRVNVIA
jgi:hypothetical protein